MCLGLTILSSEAIGGAFFGLLKDLFGSVACDKHLLDARPIACNNE